MFSCKGACGEWEELGLAKRVWQNGRADHACNVVMKDSGSRWAQDKITGGGQFKELSVRILD